MFLSLPVHVWTGIPVILGEEYSPFLKKKKKTEAVEHRFYSVQWVLIHIQMLRYLRSLSVNSRVRMLCVSLNTSCQCPQRGRNKSFAGNSLQRYVTNLCLGVCPFYFQTCLTDGGKRDVANGGDCRFGTPMFFWHFSCPEGLLLYVMEPRVTVFCSIEFFFLWRDKSSTLIDPKISTLMKKMLCFSMCAVELVSKNIRSNQVH